MAGYVTEAQFNTYALDRGITVSGTPSVLLTRALDWLDVQPLKGEKAEEGQLLQWPRSNVPGVDETSIPENIKTAQIVAALIYDDGGDPMGAIGPRVISQRVEGAVSRTFSDKGNQSILYPQLSLLLSGLLRSTGSTFEVSRG